MMEMGVGALGGCSYVFNLVVGTGILALPSVLITGGWVRDGSFSLSLLLQCTHSWCMFVQF
jgi:hypothetical protein